VSFFSDDAIDIGTQTPYAYIYGNWLQHCNYGVTVGETSFAIVENNVSLENDGGIEVHNGSTVYCNNNVFYKNTIGISAYHAEQAGETGGTILLTNCIISQSMEADFDTLASSSLSIDYSLSDKGILPGDSNLFADPKFNDTLNGDFSLKNNSPCIGKGKPDGHGNPTDIGLVNQVPVNPEELSYAVTDELKLFPNPATSYLSINNTYSPSCILKCIIYDVSGKIRKEILLNTGVNLVNLTNLSTGTYLVMIYKDDARLQTTKILKR
jgi:hypothetical protein